MPSRILSQVSEILKSVLTKDSMIEKLNAYEKQMYGQYNKIVLNDSGIPNIMKVINDITMRMTTGMTVNPKKQKEASPKKTSKHDLAKELTIEEDKDSVSSDTNSVSDVTQT